MSARGLAFRDERVFAKMRRVAQLKRIQKARAKDPRILKYLGEDIGVAAGLMCVKQKGKDADVEEFAVDYGMDLAHSRLEQEIAIERGDWKQRIEHSVPAEASPLVVALASELTIEQIRALKARAEKQQQPEAPIPAEPV